MSGRGGRGGRGGRFGRGMSAAAELIRDNLEELDLDDELVRGNANNVGSLYPESFQFYPPTELSQCEIDEAKKTREITCRFQASPYYITQQGKAKDIERYRDKSSEKEKNSLALVGNFFDGSGAGASLDDGKNIPAFVPSELLVEGVKSISSGKKGIRKSDLSRLEQMEKAEASGSGARSGEKKDKEEEEEEEMEEDEGEEEEDDDYGVDHYASDDGGDDGDDEPIM